MQSGCAVALHGRLDSHCLLSGDGDTPANPAVSVAQTYRTYGARDCAAHLYGDFALVLWDSVARRLILSRSPSGHWPLCYRLRGAELRFANIPQALLGGTDTAPVPDEQGMAEWLALRPQLSNRTMFEEIRRVTPGTSVLFEDGRIEVVNHWCPETLEPLRLRDHREYAEALRETLQIAVSDRLPANGGDVAAQLSGGLDSSTVTALAAEQLAPDGRKVFAFTAVPGEIPDSPVDGRFFDESGHAAAVAALYPNVVHTAVRTRTLSLFETLDRHTDVEAAPPFNPHHLQWIDSTYFAAAATGCTTLLTGSMGNATISASGDLAPVAALQQGRLAEAYRLFQAGRASGVRSLNNLPGMLLTAFAPSVLDDVDRVRGVRRSIEDFTGLRTAFAAAHGIDLARWNRRVLYSSVRAHTMDLLDRFDAGMFHETPRRLYGLNAVDPTFDRRVVELTVRIPMEQYFADGIPRALIRTAMEGRLPDKVRLERRRGLQSADFLSMLVAERESIAAELGRMQEIDLLRRALDLPLLQERVQWSAAKAIAYGWHPYSNRLMRAVSLGRFVRRMMDGSLFSTAPAAAAPTVTLVL